MECRPTSRESVIKRVTDVEKASQSRALNNTVGHAEIFALGRRRTGVWNEFERNVLMFTMQRPGPAAFQINRRTLLYKISDWFSHFPPRKYSNSFSYDAHRLLPSLSPMQKKKRQPSAKGSLVRSSPPLFSFHGINSPGQYFSVPKSQTSLWRSLDPKSRKWLPQRPYLSAPE
jgi:hypothetical protein